MYESIDGSLLPCLRTTGGGNSPSTLHAAWQHSTPSPLQQDTAGLHHAEASEFDEDSPFDRALLTVNFQGDCKIHLAVHVWSHVC